MHTISKILLISLIASTTGVFLKAQDTVGLIVVNSDGYGQKRQLAIENAQYRAIEKILFRGIPGTLLNVPLVANESEAKSKHQKYFEQLKAGRFKDFIHSTNVTSDFVKNSKGARNIAVQTEINYNALRLDLEQNQVIRKFGY